MTLQQTITYLTHITSYVYMDCDIESMILGRLNMALTTFPELTTPNSSSRSISKIKDAHKRCFQVSVVFTQISPVVGYSRLIDVFELVNRLGLAHFKRGAIKLFDRNPLWIYALQNSLRILQNGYISDMVSNLPLKKKTILKRTLDISELIEQTLLEIQSRDAIYETH